MKNRSLPHLIKARGDPALKSCARGDPGLFQHPKGRCPKDHLILKPMTGYNYRTGNDMPLSIVKIPSEIRYHEFMIN